MGCRQNGQFRTCLTLVSRRGTRLSKAMFSSRVMPVAFLVHGSFPPAFGHKRELLDVVQAKSRRPKDHAN